MFTIAQCRQAYDLADAANAIREQAEPAIVFGFRMAINPATQQPYKVGDEDVLTTRSVEVQAMPNPLLRGLIARHDSMAISDRGEYTGRIITGLRDQGQPELGSHGLRGLTDLLKVLDPALVQSQEFTAGNKIRNLNDSTHGRKAALVRETDKVALGRNYWNNKLDIADAEFPTNGNRFGVFSIKVGGTGKVTFRFETHHITVPAHVLPEELGVDLNHRPANDAPAKSPSLMRPAQAAALAEWLHAQGAVLIDADAPFGATSGPFAELRSLVANSVIAIPQPGRPGAAAANVGTKIVELVELEGLDAPGEGRASVDAVLSADKLHTLATDAPAVNSVVHPAVHDVLDMAAALENPIDAPELRDYQRKVVAAHAITKFGYLNASDPGTGKTIMALAGMRLRAQRIPAYRGLVVVEANVRDQWSSEIVEWMPEARVVTINKGADERKLRTALAEVGDQPLVVVASYSMMKYAYEVMAVRDEIAAAEAAAEAEAIAAERERAKIARAERKARDEQAKEERRLEREARRAERTARRGGAPAGDVVANGQRERIDGLLDQMFADMALFDTDGVVTEEATPAETVEVPAADAVEILMEEVDEVAPAAEDIAVVDGEDVEGGDTEMTLGEMLMDTWWHDLIADEAEVLRSTTAKQAKVLWRIRTESAQVAVALTGTPINKGIDDLGQLVSWCRNDPHLFKAGVKLSQQFDVTKDADLEEFSDAMGPVVFRCSSSETGGEIPSVNPVIMKLKPSAPEMALATEAKEGLKRVSLELETALVAHEKSLLTDEMKELMSPEELAEAAEALKEARTALRDANAAHLGGTSLARMACSDPAALLTSSSAGAALLAGQGLIEAATRETGTKRKAVVADTVERIGNGEQVLIFTEYATVAQGLITDLGVSEVTNSEGITRRVKVGAVLGGGGTTRDRYVREFQAGDIDVLVLTSSGEKGLNLQTANTIVHYDLPWAPKGVIQRTGRALRLNSPNTVVNVVFPIMEGTIEERIAARVVMRAVESMYALDKSRGIDITKTDMGKAIGGLASAMTETRAGRAEGESLLDVTLALVA